MSLLLLSLVALAIFAGALNRSTFGFGESLVSMPLLALLPIDFHTSISLVGLAGIVVALFTTIAGRHYVNWQALVRIFLGVLVGIPIGILLVKQLPTEYVTNGLGVFLIVYGSVSIGKILIKKARKKAWPKAPIWAVPFGTLSGILGAAYNSHGVPIVVYGTMQKWKPKQFRSTLQANFLLSGIFIVAGQALGGLWTEELPLLFVISLPGIIAATLLGMWLAQRIPSGKFERYVYIVLVILGLLLLLN